MKGLLVLFCDFDLFVLSRMRNITDLNLMVLRPTTVQVTNCRFGVVKIS
jgi:hypothetical protein